MKRKIDLKTIYSDLDEEIRFYESHDLKVGLCVPCPMCGIVMVDMGLETNHRLMCPECGIVD